MVNLTGNEPFKNGHEATEFRLRDFWAWQASDLLDNTLRGALAEFIVAKALGVSTAESRKDWGPYDIVYDGHHNIEVKASAYLQSWEQSKPSQIKFSIRPAREWIPKKGYTDKIIRLSDIYIFCLFTETDREKADPLNLDQWEFYMISTDIINEKCKEQKTITLNSLLKLSPLKSDFSNLHANAKRILSAMQEKP